MEPYYQRLSDKRDRGQQKSLVTGIVGHFAAGPCGPAFDPEGQVTTLWARTSWSTGSDRHVR
jgi:hypothetical protein